MSVTLCSWKDGEDLQIIRHLLKFLNVEYSERIYSEAITTTGVPQVILPSPPRDDDHDCENKSETIVQMEVPFLIDHLENLACGKTNIIYHLARIHSLVGTKEYEIKKVESAEAEANEIKEIFAKLKDDNESESRDLYLKNLNDNLKELSNILRLNMWFAGEIITYVDFMLYEVLKENVVSFPDLVNSYNNLKCFIKRFDDLISCQNHEEQEEYFLKLIESENLYDFKLA